MPHSWPVEAVSTKARLFAGFADASRLLILETLRSGPLTVHEIVRSTGLTQPNESNQLCRLRECALVRRERFADYELANVAVASTLLAGNVLLGQAAGARRAP